MLECVELRDELHIAAQAPQAIREAPINTGTSGGIGRRLVSTFLALTVIALVGTTVAWAEPAAITEAKSEAEALQALVDDLGEQMDAAVEDYNYAQAKLEQTSAAAKKTQAKLTESEADLEVMRAQLTDRIIEIYKQGHLGMLDTLSGATSFSDLVNRLDLLERLSVQDSEMVDQVRAYRDR
jgi:peptidoglycan hydrolase CwlO-like protein